MSNLIRHTACPHCSSSDAYALYDDGHGHCYSCSTTDNVVAIGDAAVNQRRKPTLKKQPRTHYADLVDRGISEQTCRFWKYSVDDDGNHYANYYSDVGEYIAAKVRSTGKQFHIEGDASSMPLYGQWLWKPNPNKKIIITEGEVDALSVSQLQKNRWPVVSVTNGAQSALKTCRKNFDYLDGFQHVVIMFDMDEPGRRAAQQVAELFEPGKASIAQLPCKDANECLLEGKGDKVIDAIFNSKPYRPDGIVGTEDLFERLTTKQPDPIAQFPWQCLNDRLGGMFERQLITLTAGSGAGKSQIAREIAYKLVNDGHAVGLLMLEESVEATAYEMLSLHLGKRLRLRGRVDYDQKEVSLAYDEFFKDKPVYFYDHFGSMEIDNLLSRVRYMVQGLGCKVVVLDHLSIVVSGLDGEDERKLIDRAMTRLRMLVEQTGVCMILISHLKRLQGNEGHEDGMEIKLSHLRGSGAIGQLSDVVLGVERDQQSSHSNEVDLRIIKSRLYGETGLAGRLVYNTVTGRLEEGEAKALTENEEKNYGF